MKKKTGFNGYVFEFSVDYNVNDTINIIDIHRHLIKKILYKIMFWLIKKTFIGLLRSIADASNHTKCVSLSNQNARFKLPLLIYILMNTVKNSTSIYFRLNLVDMLDVVILWSESIATSNTLHFMRV